MPNSPETYEHFEKLRVALVNVGQRVEAERQARERHTFYTMLVGGLLALVFTAAITVSVVMIQRNHQAMCDGVKGISNSLISQTPPPQNDADRQRLQARIDAYTAELNHETGCHITLTPAPNVANQN